MLSRVAAVKAPRTQNRRRVTGSRGRRREGRESERQRLNMSRHLFTSAVLLLLVVMICCSSGGATQAVEPSSDPKFEWKDITEGDVTVKSFGAPGLLKVGSDVFAVAEAQCKKDGEDTFTGIASQLLTIKGDNKPEEALKNARVIRVLEKGAPTSKRVDVSRPTTVVQGNDIYMLVGKYSPTAATGKEDGEADDSGLLLVKGNVSAEAPNKKIDWKSTESLPRGIFVTQLESLTGLIGGGGSGVKMDDGTLLFPLEGTKKKNDETEKEVKTASLIIHNLAATPSWKLSKGMSADGCSDPSVVEWKDKLMMMTACGDGRRRVYESGDKGDSWTEALGTLSRVWGSKQEGEGKAVGSGFTTATFVDGGEQRNMMLVTLPVYAKEKEKGELHLWLTDNTHIVDIGPVSGKDDDAAASALLYKSVTSGTDDNKREELIALYEKKKGDEKENPSPGMVSVRLTEQLQRVKDVLATWKEVDKRVSELCPSESAVQVTSPESACKNTKITDGLVGFLSGNFSDDTWRDEYLGVNATVKKGEEEGASAGVAETAESSDGVKFTGAWAEWPVGRQGENQLYHFANYNFTLVATASIDGEPKEGDTPIPVIGVMMDAENPVLLGLSYNNKEKKWQMLCGGKPTEVQNHIEGQEKTHQVAILLQNSTQGSAYVDGRRVLENVQCQLESEEDKKISHFYIGGDGSNKGSQEGVSVTVTNVLLYNRPLDGNGIAALNAIKALITPPKETSAQEIVVPSPGRTPQAGQEPLNGGEGADGLGVPKAASIASTSIPVGQTVQQLASETSPDGNADVDVSPSSSGNPTVGEGSADTIQGDGPHTPSVGNTAAAADTNVLTAETVGHDGPALTADMSVSSGADGETAGGTDGQEGIHPQDRDVNATALNSSLGNSSQGNNSDAGTVSERRALPLLLLLLGLWGFAAV
ncbi:putative trans-sialidase, Group VI [Trypanosoma cruzi]|uniref:Putative trans-sialidase, Group VI n=1 Tax=Trypanosoma cruzi TaxID=5693 RepID=A0A2V2XJP4_TRYCR|nr:putative trans-sialidase, Group VI [Trypanosoma cruzi]